jgi:hypothetical protein
MAAIEKIALAEHFLDLVQDAYFQMLTGDAGIFASPATKPIMSKLTDVDAKRLAVVGGLGIKVDSCPIATATASSSIQTSSVPSQRRSAGMISWPNGSQPARAGSPAGRHGLCRTPQAPNRNCGSA